MTMGKAVPQFLFEGLRIHYTMVPHSKCGKSRGFRPATIEGCCTPPALVTTLR
jgi:hypothetical protein